MIKKKYKPLKLTWISDKQQFFKVCRMRYLCRAYESPEDLVQMQVLIQQIWGGASESVFIFANSGTCPNLFLRE